MNNAYIVVSNKPWGKRLFDEKIAQLPGRWRFISDGLETKVRLLGPDVPRYIFFLHWSEKVPAVVLDRHKCIAFHMTDLPFGRGGSPLQNLIADGFRETMITAFRMTDEIDAGPIYMKRPLSLEGLAEEIYIRAGEVCAEMIENITENNILPVAQRMEFALTEYRRRKPSQSEVLDYPDLKHLFDHLRMLDAETYPRAFLVHQGFRYEFSRPALRDGRIEADVRITREGE